MVNLLRTRAMRRGRTAACGLFCLLVCGCLAQQAELKDVERNLGTKITKLDQRDKELQQTVKQAKVDIDKLVSETRARLSQEITALREEELPLLRGGLDKDAHQVSTLRSRLDDYEHQLAKRSAALEKSQADQTAAAKADRDRLHDDLLKLGGRLDAMNATIGTVSKKLGEKLDEQDKGLAASESKVQQLEAQNRSLNEQMTLYKQALGDYKKALALLGEKLVQEEQRTTELSNRIGGRTDQLASKVDTDTKATTAYLNDVNKNVGLIAKAVENMSAQLVPRVEDQERRLDELTKMMHSMDAQVAAANQQVAAANQAAAQLRQSREREQAAIRTSEDHPQPSVQSAQPTQAPQSSVSEPASAPVVASTPRESTIHSGQAREVYDRYITTFKQGNLDGALQGFSQFLSEYPTSDLAANAQYWLGECYYGKKDYARAIDAFDRVKVGYPSSEKVPAALLKKGFAYLALKDRNRASSVWRQVVDGYPNSPEAGKALEKLAQLKQIR